MGIAHLGCLAHGKTPQSIRVPMAKRRRTEGIIVLPDSEGARTCV